MKKEKGKNPKLGNVTDFHRFLQFLLLNVGRELHTKNCVIVDRPKAQNFIIHSHRFGWAKNSFAFAQNQESLRKLFETKFYRIEGSCLEFIHSKILMNAENILIKHKIKVFVAKTH